MSESDVTALRSGGLSDRMVTGLGLVAHLRRRV